jgi:hypothetical protein
MWYVYEGGVDGPSSFFAMVGNDDWSMIVNDDWSTMGRWLSTMGRLSVDDEDNDWSMVRDDGWSTMSR